MLRDPLTLALTFGALTFGTTGCGQIQAPRRVAFPWQGIADVAAPTAPAPLTAPHTPLRGERGAASLGYPASFVITIRPDGAIGLPKDPAVRLKDRSVLSGGVPIATISDSGEVTGPALRRKYTFNEKGELIDDAGRGVRLSPAGRVRALGGSVRQSDVMMWVSESGAEQWDYTGWRTLSILSLILLENLLPETVGATGPTPQLLPWQGIAEAAAPSPIVPLGAPNTNIRGGCAQPACPPSLAVTLRADGTIAFPQDTTGRIKGGAIVVGSTVLAAATDGGDVAGSGLKRKYTFGPQGQLVDPVGNGVRLLPSGQVLAFRADGRSAAVMAWSAEKQDTKWDLAGWRTATIASLLVIENLMPDAVGL